MLEAAPVSLAASRSRGLRVATLLVATSCLSSNESGALGQGGISYVCPSIGSSTSQPSPDAWCAANAHAAAATTIPDVVVGAPFQLQSDEGDSSALQPAVAALAQSGPAGWSLVQAGWLGFLVWSGSDVADFTHVRGRTVASLGWQPNPATASIDVGAPATDFAIVPLADDGTTLGGAIACDFAVSDPSLASIEGAGRVVNVTATGEGDVLLTASCAGTQAQASLRLTRSDLDGGGD